ncbi:transposase [Paenibacillus lautus]|uniref:transposase n=1 Tax=Paenibacillus lautus TaxID=1401 RepID=UPI00384D2342
MARPSKYESHVKPKLNLVESWARDGLIDEQIAHNLGINVSTLYDYKNKYPEFTEALKNGKDDIDVMVENALLKRALGYTYDEVTLESGVETKRVTKEVQPDTTAQIFWLKNRRPQAWRDKQDLDVSGDLNFKVSLPKGFGDDGDD